MTVMGDPQFIEDGARTDDISPEQAEPKTILQNLRYFSRKELVQYVCHAGDDDAEDGEHTGSTSMFEATSRDVGHFHDGNDVTASAVSDVTAKPAKRQNKLVRFNSRPQIYRDDTMVNYDCLQDVHRRPGTPIAADDDDDDDDDNSANKPLHLPPLKKHVIERERARCTAATANKTFSSKSSDNFDYSNGHKKLNARAKKYLANVSTHPKLLGCSPPHESMLRKVLTRGAFSSGQQQDGKDHHVTGQKTRIHNPHKLRSQSMRWASPKPSRRHQRHDDVSSGSSSGRSDRSSSPTRHERRQDPHDVNRELMTSPLTTLQLRDAATCDSSRSSVPQSMTNQYPVLSADEHLEFIRYALSPAMEPSARDSHRDSDRATNRDRASTISGGERPDFLLHRKRLHKLSNTLSHSNSSFSSIEKINIEKKFESSKPYIRKPLHL